MDKYLLLRLMLYFFELCACVTGIFYWKKVKDTYWKWFVAYLAVITVTELSAEYIGTILKNEALNIIINIYWSIPLQFLFFCWLFYRWFQKESKRKWALAGAVTFIAALVIEVSFFDKQNLVFLSLSYLTGNIVLLLLVLLFLLNFIQSDEILTYRTSMMFWVGLGLLIFYLGSLPFFGLWNTLAIKYPDVFNVYWVVQMSLNCLMYLFFSIAFIWGNPKS